MVPVYTEYWQYPAVTVASIVFVPFFRAIHFYAAHRFMHPWRLGKGIPDPGMFLYRKVTRRRNKGRKEGKKKGGGEQKNEVGFFEKNQHASFFGFSLNFSLSSFTPCITRQRILDLGAAFPCELAAHVKYLSC
jgi:hypothetical protein